MTAEIKRAQMTHTQFYAACECLKKHKQTFLDERPVSIVAAAKLSEMCGFPVSKAAMADLRKATGIEWEPRRKESSASSVRGNSIRTVVIALYRLYRKLGEEVPQTLQEAYAAFNAPDKNGMP